MSNKKIKVFLLLLLISGVVYFVYSKLKEAKPEDTQTRQINPFIGNIEISVSTTGTALPKNRLEVKPPVNGRIESVLVKEGDPVKKGQALAWMSSTERAALLDAAHAQGEKSLEYWKEVYKAIPLISPIQGDVIVAKTQPGQTVTTADAVVVLSDELIVRAQVDETDIGKVKLGQKVTISMDAYPETKINAVVEHIYYESKTVNNVTIYEVDLTCENVPLFFRSGMNASVSFIQNSKEEAVLIPLEAVTRENNENYVFVKETDKALPTRRSVQLGLSDDKHVEVISGVDPSDTLIVKSKKFSLPQSKMGSNPFMPFRKKNSGQKKP